MALSIDATFAGNISNSYATLEEVEAYFNSRLNSGGWSSASEPDKIKALVMSARQIDQLNLIGSKYTTTQALEFPRVPINNDIYMLNFPHLMNGAGVYVKWYDSDGNLIIPLAIKYAQCEQAFFNVTLMSDIDRRSFIRSQGLESIKASGLNESYSPKMYHLCETAVLFLNSVGAIDSSINLKRA